MLIARHKTAVEDPGSLLAQRRRERMATRKGIGAVEVCARLMAALAEANRALSLKELSQRTGLQPSKVHRYLASCARCELVYQDPVSGLYDLGSLTLRLGFAAQGRIDGLQRSVRAIDQLARETGFTAMVTAWSDRGPVIVRWIQGPKSVYTSLSLGAVLPLLRSATGRIYLSYISEQLTQPLLLREQRSAKGLRAQVSAIQKEVRAAGCCEVSGVLIPGLVAVAAPVFDGGGAIVAAMTLLSSSSVGLTVRARAALLRAAASVSRELGWQQPRSGGVSA